MRQRALGGEDLDVGPSLLEDGEAEEVVGVAVRDVDALEREVLRLEQAVHPVRQLGVLLDRDGGVDQHGGVLAADQRAGDGRPVEGVVAITDGLGEGFRADVHVSS